MKKKQLCLLIALCIFALMIIALWAESGSADNDVTCWILCKPGNYVNVRETPSKRGQQTGFLDCGDSFESDGTCENGYVLAFDTGDAGDGWIYCGFVVTDEPVKVFENYVCVAPKRVACRRWCDGPRIKGKIGWLNNGDEVQVFYKTEEWCVTSRGYIKSEWLEPDP